MAITPGTATVVEQLSSQTITGTIPTGAGNGDLLIVLFGLTTTVATFTAPGGAWIELIAPTVLIGASDRAIAAYYQVVTNIGSVVAPTATTTTAAYKHCAIVQAYSGVDRANPFDVIGPVARDGGGSMNLVVPSITTSVAGTLVISGCVIDSSTADTITQPPQMSLAAISTGTGRRTGFAEEARPTAGATGTRTWSETATLGINAFLVAINPAGVAGAWFRT